MEMTNISYRSKISDYLSANKIEIIFLSIIGISFYWLNYYSVIGFDDWFYGFICEDIHFFNASLNRLPIEDIEDVFISQCNHYQYVNGRFLLHFVIQLFVGIFGLRAFQVANAIMFVFLIKYLCRLSIPINRQNKILFYIITSLIFWILMGFIEIGFGYLSVIAFSVNYLWGSTLFVYILYLFQTNKQTNKQTNTSWRKNLWIFIISFICGASNEAFSVGLSVGLFFYFCLNRKEYKGAIVWLTIGLWLGTSTLIFAPANWIRFINSNSDGNILFLFKKIISFYSQYNIIKLIPIIITTLIFIIGYKYKRLIKTIINKHQCFLYISLFIFLFLSFVGYSGAIQMFCGIFIICCILICQLIFYHNQWVLNYYKIILTTLLILFVIHYLSVLNFREWQNKEYSIHKESYINNNHGCYVYSNTNDCFLTKPYGINLLKFSRIKHDLAGINQTRNCMLEIKAIPNVKSMTLLESNDRYNLYDADWCFVIKSNEYKLYDVMSNDFTHKNWILKLFNKYSSSATTSINLETYPVTIDNTEYQIALKWIDDFTINKIEITERK